MSVYQISRIQIRRGQANQGTGFPQLASGELGWAIDTQELYIGNGSVSEGAPAVGNTRILTEQDFIDRNPLALLDFVYRDGSTIQTGASINAPIKRSLQSRLDDSVIVADFGALADGTDVSVELQRALDQLFSDSSLTTSTGVASRVVLQFGPGTYIINSPLNIPSYASLVGAGADKTILSFTSNSTAINFVKDDATSISYNNQPRYITMKGMTIKTITSNQTCLNFDVVRDSYFEDMIIQGNWGQVTNVASNGIRMNAYSSIVTSENNLFKHVTIRGFSQAVLSVKDIINNRFEDCYFTDLRQGFALGSGMTVGPLGQQFGPRNTDIINCRFFDIKRHGVYVEIGSGNTVSGSRFKSVGNDNLNPGLAKYPQVYFKNGGNTSDNNKSDRPDALYNDVYITNIYVPEIGGITTYANTNTRNIAVGYQPVSSFIFRLPVSTDASGTPGGSVNY